ncbi:MAG: hypothetical protein QOC89_2740 [Paraburkholderia sp.]|nr:hypothetical protein [Paraburkholderia sp.]
MERECETGRQFLRNAFRPAQCRRKYDDRAEVHFSERSALLSRSRFIWRGGAANIGYIASLPVSRHVAGVHRRGEADGSHRAQAKPMVSHADRSATHAVRSGC